MIIRVEGQNFKGQTFSQPLGRLTVLVGPNAAGKTSRLEALSLVLTGALPSGERQLNKIWDRIHNVNNPSLPVIARCKDNNNNELQRSFARSESGLAQLVGFNGEPIRVQSVGSALRAMGGPQTFDLHEWSEMSDQKKIAFVFDRVTKGDKRRDLIREEERLVAELNATRKQLASTKEVIVSLTRAREECGVVPYTLEALDESLAKYKAELQTALEQQAQVRSQQQRQQVAKEIIKNLRDEKPVAAKEQETEVTKIDEWAWEYPLSEIVRHVKQCPHEKECKVKTFLLKLAEE